MSTLVKAPSQECLRKILLISAGSMCCAHFGRAISHGTCRLATHGSPRLRLPGRTRIRLAPRKRRLSYTVYMFPTSLNPCEACPQNMSKFELSGSKKGSSSRRAVK